MAVDWGYDFYESSYSIPNNTSQVRLRIWITTSGSSYTYDTKYGTVWFAGEQGIEYTLPPNTTTVVYDQTKTWAHNATTGEGTAAFACELPTTPSGGTKGVGDTYITLTKIPRYLTITNYTISQINVNSVRIDWATSDPRDNTQLSINNGAWKGSAEYDPNEHVASDNKSGYFIVSGLSAKTNYNMKIRIKRADSQQWTESQNKSITTYAAPTIGLNSRTETSIKLNYNMNDSTQQVSTLQYRKKKSTESSWSGWTTVSGAANTSSGNFNVTGLTENTTYNFEVKFTRKANSTVYTASTSQTTYAYPYATTSPNFIVGNSLSITLKNDASRTCKVYLKIGNNTSSLYVQTNNTTASGFNTAAWKEWLYANLPTKDPTAYQVVVVETASSTTRTRNAGNTVIINETECKPIYDTSNGFDYTDINTNVTALTGNNQIIVKGYSNIAATVSTAQKATAPSGTSSSIVDYTLKVGNQTARNDYSSDSAVRIPATGSIQGAMPDTVSGQGTVSVIATDSRGLTTTSSKTATVKEYTQPVISNITATRSLNGAGEEVTLNLNGTYWKESFGTSNNTIVSVIYKFRKSTTQTWTTGTTTITPTLSGDNNTFKVENLPIRGDTSEGEWTANDTYIIRIEVKDTLLNAVSSNVAGEYTIVAGTPAIAMYKNNIAIGKKYDESLGGKLQISGTAFNYNNGAIAGTKQASSTTIPDLLTELRYTNGQMGSVNITTAYTLNNITIATGWYNYLYIPHRIGGKDGAAVGDNCNYGILLLTGMTANTPMYKIRYAGGGISSLEALARTVDNVAQAQQLQNILTNPTSGTTYYPFFNAIGTTNGTYTAARSNNGLSYYTVEGTTSATGTGELCLGNSTSSGTAGNKKGQLRMMSEKNGSVYLRPTAGSTTARWVTFPDLGGTVAVNSGIANASNSWKVVNFGNFKLYFYFYNSNGRSFSANGWNSWDISLPVTFNSAKMVLTTSCQASDNILRLQCGTWHTSTVMRVSWDNRYSAQINNISINISALLIDFS